jgi:hypothetical protein
VRERDRDAAAHREDAGEEDGVSSKMVIFMAAVSLCGAAPNSGNGGAERLQLKGSGGSKGFIAGERDGGAPLCLWDAGRRRRQSWGMVHVDRWGWFSWAQWARFLDG